MSLPEFDAIAAKYGIQRCRGILPNGQTCYINHDNGRCVDGIVHWSDRRPTRAGIRRFLHLAALYYNDDTTGWMRYYFAQRTVTRWLQELRIEMPRSITAHYKAELRAMIVRQPAGPSGGSSIREEALAWTRS